MLERFTDQARKVMVLADQEAQRLNHEYIGTEHILLGFVKGGGFGATVLKNLGTDFRKVLLAVEKRVKRGPDVITTGRLPMTPGAEKVIEYAISEARDLGEDYVGTEHLLLGLLRVEDAVAAQVLAQMGVKLQEVREEIKFFYEVGGSERRMEEEQAASGKSEAAEKAQAENEECERRAKAKVQWIVFAVLATLTVICIILNKIYQWG